MNEHLPTSSVSLRGITCALVTAVGALLLIVAPGRSDDWFAEGLMLAIFGVVLIADGLTLVVSTHRTILYVAGILTTVVAVWLVITRTSGYPFGPWSSVTPQMGPYEVLILVLSIISLTLAIAALAVGTEHLGTPGIRFDTIAPLAIILVALPGLAVSSWADDAAHILGSNQVVSSQLGSSSTHSHTTSSNSMSGMDPNMLLSMMTADELTQ